MAIEADIATMDALEKENVCLEGSSQVFETEPSTIASKLKLVARCTPDAKIKVINDLM